MMSFKSCWHTSKERIDELVVTQVIALPLIHYFLSKLNCWFVHLDLLISFLAFVPVQDSFKCWCWYFPSLVLDYKKEVSLRIFKIPVVLENQKCLEVINFKLDSLEFNVLWLRSVLVVQKAQVPNLLAQPQTYLLSFSPSLFACLDFFWPLLRAYKLDLWCLT